MTEILEASNALADVGGRLRVLERKQYTLSEKVLIINQNMIEEYKKLLTDVKTIKEEIKESKKEVFELQELIKGIAKDMDGFAKKNSLKILEKYINLWNPMNFITEEEVVKLIDTKIKEGDKNSGRI